MWLIFYYSVQHIFSRQISFGCGGTLNVIKIDPMPTVKDCLKVQDNTKDGEQKSFESPRVMYA